MIAVMECVHVVVERMVQVMETARWPLSCRTEDLLRECESVMVITVLRHLIKIGGGVTSSKKL